LLEIFSPSHLLARKKYTMVFGQIIAPLGVLEQGL
jgi:hypothetical protein